MRCDQFEKDGNVSDLKNGPESSAARLKEFFLNRNGRSLHHTALVELRLRLTPQEFHEFVDFRTLQRFTIQRI